MAIKINLTEEDLKKSKRPELPPISQGLLEEHLKSPGIHPKSDLDMLKPDAETPKPATYEELKENFRKFCQLESSLGDNFNTGMYIKIETLEKMIQEIKADSSEVKHLYVGFGLRRAKLNRKKVGEKMEENNDWNCFHLLIGAATPSVEIENGEKVSKKPTSKSKIWYSTYDGIERDYTGPKPGCPPFTAPEE